MRLVWKEEEYSCSFGTLRHFLCVVRQAENQWLTRLLVPELIFISNRSQTERGGQQGGGTDCVHRRNIVHFISQFAQHLHR